LIGRVVSLTGPGGWTPESGPATLDWRIEQDLYEIANWSFKYMIKVTIKTIKAVLNKDKRVKVKRDQKAVAGKRLDNDKSDSLEGQIYFMFV